jgi:hypothetical protein
MTTSRRIGDNRFGFRPSRDFKADWLTTRFNNNSERQERAALTLQIDKAGEPGKHFGSGLKAVRIAERQRRDVVNRPTNGIQNRSAALLHFGLSESAGYRQFHEDSVVG